MNNILLTNGDSWTYGAEIDSPDILQIPFPECLGNNNRYKPGFSVASKINDGYRTERIWPTKLANILNYKNINIAEQGVSNQCIFRTTQIKIIELLKTTNSKDIVVVIGWSDPIRKSLIFEDLNNNLHFQTIWLNVESSFYNTNEAKQFANLYITALSTEFYYIESYINHIFTLHEFLKTRNIKHLFFNAFFQIGNIKNRLNLLKHKYNSIIGCYGEDVYSFEKRLNHLENLWDLIDHNIFYKSENLTSMCDYINDLQLELPLYGAHPSPEAHEKWAITLSNYITETILK